MKYVVHDTDDKYMSIDPSCGWPAFDDVLCGRTKRFDTSRDAQTYIRNLQGGYGTLHIKEDKE